MANNNSSYFGGFMESLLPKTKEQDTWLQELEKPAKNKRQAKAAAAQAKAQARKKAEKKATLGLGVNSDGYMMGAGPLGSVKPRRKPEPKTVEELEREWDSIDGNFFGPAVVLSRWSSHVSDQIKEF
jgi:hypothetical protein